MFGIASICHHNSLFVIVVCFTLFCFYMSSGDQTQVPVLLTEVSPQILASSFLIKTNLVLLIISIINLFLFSNV